MAQSDEDADSRHIEPSQKRLDDARAKGDLAKSNDLLTAASYGGWILAFALGGGLMLHSASVGRALIEHATPISAQTLAGAQAGLGGWLAQMVLGPLALGLVPAAFVLAVLFAQRALVFAPDKLSPRLSRLSPLANAKQKFGADGLFEFFKSAIKMAVIAITLGLFLVANGDLLLATVGQDPVISFGIFAALCARFMALAALVSLCIGGVDFIWQRFSLIRRNRMTQEEAKQEQKESDGDPHAKAERRRRGQEIAMNQMLAEVDKASVVIVNPTHFAVALKWSKGSRTAPVLVAKGVDEIARAIRERAALSGVPIRSDPPTARAIHAGVEIGQPIDRAHYQAVAAAIRFAEAMRKRARGVVT